LTAVTATITADVTVIEDTTIVIRQPITADCGSPSGRATDRGQAHRASSNAGVGGRGARPHAAARPAGVGTVEELLHERAGLRAGNPGRAALRAQSIEAGLPLALSLAARYRGRGEPQDDLRQVAFLALIRAVDGYDPARQVAFASYAVPTIVGALKHHFRDTTWRVRVPRRIQDLAIGVGAAREGLAQQLGRWPTVAELAGHLGVGDCDIAVALNSWQFRHPESLDQLSAAGGEERQPFFDAVGVIDVRFEAVTDWETLQPLLAALTVRDRGILALRFIHDLTQAEIAVRVGVSQMHISRLLARVLARLRTSMLDDEQGPRQVPDRVVPRRPDPRTPRP
jgi:RNA polymerase sigma-B factor